MQLNNMRKQQIIMSVLRILKDTVVACSKVISQHLPKETVEYHKATNWKADNLTEIQNGCLQSLKRHCYFNLLAADPQTEIDTDLRINIKEVVMSLVLEHCKGSRSRG
jgi:hypothetical protein